LPPPRNEIARARFTRIAQEDFMKPRRLFSAAAALVALALFALAASQAATPGSGTVSTSNPLVT